VTPERQRELEPGKGVSVISADEWRQGWHYCPDFDGDLCGPPWPDELGACEWCGFDGTAPYPGEKT
jgi:hypothetical protein